MRLTKFGKLVGEEALKSRKIEKLIQLKCFDCFTDIYAKESEHDKIESSKKKDPSQIVCIKCWCKSAKAMLDSKD